MTWHYLSMGPDLAFIAARVWLIGALYVVALLALVWWRDRE